MSAANGICQETCTQIVIIRLFVQELGISSPQMWRNSFIKHPSTQDFCILRMSMLDFACENLESTHFKTVALTIGKWLTVCADTVELLQYIRLALKKCTEFGMTCKARSISDVSFAIGCIFFQLLRERNVIVQDVQTIFDLCFHFFGLYRAGT